MQDDSPVVGHVVGRGLALSVVEDGRARPSGALALVEEIGRRAAMAEASLGKSASTSVLKRISGAVVICSNPNFGESGAQPLDLLEEIAGLRAASAPR